MTRGEEWKRMVEIVVDLPQAERPALIIPGPQRMYVHAGLNKLAGNPRPYWSVTADLHEMIRMKNGRLRKGRMVAAGSLHDEIVEHVPELAPIVALHLSDDEGTPMHAVENALHWMGLTGQTVPVRATRVCDLGHEHREVVGERMVPWHVWPEGRPQLCAHLRVTEEQADRLRQYVVDQPGSDREAMAWLIRVELRQQWLREAAQALAWLEAREANDGAE